MKRLAIILAVLVIGSGLSMWCFDIKPAGVITLAAPAERASDDSGKPDHNTSEPNAPSAEETGDPNETENPPEEPSEEGRGDDNERTGRGRGGYGGYGSQPSPESAEVKGDPNDPLVAINLNNIEMKNILPKLAAWTGKVIIPTDEAMRVKVTIYAAKEIPRSEALSLIYDALRAKGIIAEISKNKLFLKPIGQAKTGYVQVITADEPLARIKDKSQVVEKYFKLKNTSPSKLVSVITPLTASYGHVTAFESSQSLSVIDTVENLFRIEQTIAQFDVPDSEMVVEEIFEIKKGDAVEIVQVLNLILNNTSSSRSRYRRSGSSSDYRRPWEGGENRGGENGGGENRGGEGERRGRDHGSSSPASSVIINAGQTPIILLPVPKHNWIIARASLDTMEEIKSWVSKLDIPETSPQEQTIISIVYVDPEEVVRLVRNTIQNMPGSQLQTSIVVEAMRESKQVVIFGSEENRKFVERLIVEIDLPVDDIYVSKVFKLEHIDPDEAKENLESLYESQAGEFYNSSYGRRGGYNRISRNVKPEDVVRVTSFPKLSQISVIATEKNMKEIEDQINKWDVPMALRKDQYLIITLKNSDPVQMVELLSTLFSEEDSSGSDWIRRMFGSGDDDSKKKIVGSLYGLLTFEPVPGTKKILVISKVPQAYDVIKALVEDLDSQEKGEVPRVITLNYADPEELCDQLNAILNERGSAATLKRRQQGLSETDFTGSEGASSSSSNNSQNQTNPGEIRPWWTQGRDDDTEMPLSNLIGKIRFIPVHRSKAILTLAPPEYYEDIEEMVKKLDQPEMQVMIEAIIVEVDHSSMTSLGMQLSSNPTFFNSIGQNAIKGNTEFNFIKEISRGLTLSANTDINILIDLLKKTVNAKILNQPNLWTKDNEEAIFFKGKSISILKASQTTDTRSTTNQYSPEDVGVTLKVRPSITPSKDVDITIQLGISDLAVETVNDQPVINRLDTTTNLIIADGETIMLGGILFQNESEIKSKVPLLGEIPVVGGLFSHEDTALRNNELLVFLTPHVITDKKSEAAKKFIVEPKDKVETLKEPKNGSKYITNPAERMQDIRKSLNDVLSKGIMDAKP